jgi:hypothetical protein
MRTFPGQIEFARSWTLCPPTQPARWITPSRLAKREAAPIGVPLRPKTRLLVEHGGDRKRCAARSMPGRLHRDTHEIHAPWFVLGQRRILRHRRAGLQPGSRCIMAFAPSRGASRGSARSWPCWAIENRRETHFRPTISSNIPVRFWAARQFPPEKKFSPKLSFGAADSSRKSAKRRRSGLS